MSTEGNGNYVTRIEQKGGLHERKIFQNLNANMIHRGYELLRNGTSRAERDQHMGQRETKY